VAICLTSDNVNGEAHRFYRVRLVD